MGAPMATHLIDAGHELRVHTRTPSRADELLARGARWCDSPEEVADGAELVFTMLGYPADVRETVLGRSGLLDAMEPGTVLVDHTTSEPTLAEEIAAAAGERGLESIDAPVSGGDVGARNGALVIMAGGGAEAFERARPALESYGRKVVLAGGPGAGQHTKMVNQIAISSGMVALCEALIYAYRSGLDVEQAIDTIGEGAAGSWSLSNYGPRMVRGDLEPGFKIDHFIKDLGIALAEARRMHLALPGLALAEQLYVGASSHGLGQKGTQALIVTLAEMSQVEVSGPLQ
jgi:3-hydroxyisobutyrate dehydrogenase